MSCISKRCLGLARSDYRIVLANLCRYNVSA